MNSPNLLNTEEAARHCASTASTFEKLRCFGGGAIFHKIGRRVVYDRADLDVWLSSKRRTSTSDTGAGCGPGGMTQ